MDDIHGDTYEVSETRDSGHGWTLYRGRPYPRPQVRGGAGGNRYVLTGDLLAYLMAHLPKDYALPISRGAIRRLRTEAGLDAVAERMTWWLDRIEDLGALTAPEFIAKHPAPARTGSERLVWLQESTVSVQRMRLLGRRIRPAGWWRDAQVAAVLRSGAHTADIAAQLDVAEGTVRRLRWMVMQD